MKPIVFITDGLFKQSKPRSESESAKKSKVPAKKTKKSAKTIDKK